MIHNAALLTARLHAVSRHSIFSAVWCVHCIVWTSNRFDADRWSPVDLRAIAYVCTQQVQFHLAACRSIVIWLTLSR